nr:TMEM175 family protein [uncultured Carboxylicivirga sp.]
MKKYIRNSSDKEEFQVSRVASFSDGVFAFAITLLVIDIKMPTLNAHSINDALLWNELKHLLPKFIGFTVSFFVIGMYWLTHHRLFKFVTAINTKLLWNNLLFLLPIVLMPFSTSFFTEYFIGSLKVPFTFYTLTICLSGFFCYKLWKIIGNPQYKISSNPGKVIVNYNITRALIVPVLFIITLLVSFITGWAYFLPILIFFVPRLITQYYSKKYPAIMKEHYR